MNILRPVMEEVLSEEMVKKDDEMGGNIPGENFLGGNFPEGIFHGGGGLMGGNFPGGGIFLEPSNMLRNLQSAKPESFS